MADPDRDHVPWDEPLPGAVGWEKYNKHHWLGGGYDDFLRFFFGRMFHEPHSTKQLEDAVAWGRQVAPQTLVDVDGRAARVRRRGLQRHRGAVRAAHLPVTVLHGSEDQVRGLAYGERLAELTGGSLVVVEGAGHGPLLRDPVLVNHEVRAFAERFAPVAPRRSRTRAPYDAGGGRSTSPPPSASGTPAATWRWPVSCAGCTPTSRSSGSPRTR